MKKKQLKRRENGLLAFGVDLSAVLKSLKKEKITLTDIKENWKNFCIEEFLQVLNPCSFKGGRLEIKALYGPVALEASARKEVIRERINVFFGSEFVKDIKIVQ